MNELERFLLADTFEPLVQLAIGVAEFAAIHPFADGNGRVGRLLIPAFLFHMGLLSRPKFYLSAYLEAHWREYHAHLLRVSRDDDWIGWGEFFLRALADHDRGLGWSGPIVSG